MRALLLALCMLACTAAQARDYTVDDLLGVESYGQTLLVPSQDMVIIEKRRGYAAAKDFAYDTYFTSRMVTRIMTASIRRPVALAPLLPQDARAGYWIGSLSPNQSRLAIFRLQDRRLALGVVDLRTRAVRWLEPTPDLPGAAPAPAWVDEDHLAYVAMTDPRLPGMLSMGTAGAQDVSALWRRQARGELTRTSVTTGGGPDGNRNDRRLVIVPVADGPARVLSAGPIVDFAIAPSRRRVAVIKTGDPTPPPASPINVGFDSRRHGLEIVDTRNGASREIDGDLLPGVLSWSGDDRLLVALRHGGSDWKRARWTMIDATGRASPLGGADTFAAVEEAPAGRPAYAGWTDASPLALVRRERMTPEWMRLSLSGATPLPMSQAARPAGSMHGAKWMLDGTRLYAVTGSRSRVVADDVRQAGPTIVDPPSRGFRLVQDPEDLGSVVTATSTGRAVRSVDGTGRWSEAVAIPAQGELVAATGGLAIVANRDRRAMTSLTLFGPGRRAALIDRINERLVDVDLPRAVDLETPGPDGTILHDWLLLPPHATRRPPLVINLYPGLTFGSALPSEAGISRHAVSDNPMLLVSAGYAVLLPSMPITGAGNPIDTILPRIDAAADAAVATGLVDGELIGLQGHSFGAYGAMVVATRSHRYKAIVAANGPYDLFATHGTMTVGDKMRLDYGIPAGASIGWTEGGQGGMGAPPAAAPAAYAAASPMLHLDRVTAPVLLIAGDLDIVDATQGERAFMELYRHGKDARLVRYWGENHTNASPANIRDYWTSTISFFDEHLKDGRTARASSMPGQSGPGISRDPSTR